MVYCFFHFPTIESQKYSDDHKILSSYRITEFLFSGNHFQSILLFIFYHLIFKLKKISVTKIFITEICIFPLFINVVLL